MNVKGIGPNRLKNIRESWQEQKEIRKIMLFLTEHGRVVKKLSRT